MKILHIIAIMAVFAAGRLQAADISWDGGASASVWGSATNWSGDVLPTGSDDVTVDVNTSLRGEWILDVNSQVFANTLTLDPQWAGATAGKIGIRGSGVLNITDGGNITISSNYTDGNAVVFAPNIAGNLNIRTATDGGDFTLVNNSETTVGFAGNATRLLVVQGRGGPDERVYFDGSGNFLMGDNSTFAGATLERIWTTDAYSGTLILSNSVTANTVNPGTDLRILGGTLKVGFDEQIGDTTTIAFGSGASVTGNLNARGITETAGILNNFSDATADLSILVDNSTALTFANFNDGGQTRGTIDIQGWSEGGSSIIFSSLIAYDWTVGENEAFVGLTIAGGTAYMTAVSNGWAVTDGSGIAEIDGVPANWIFGYWSSTNDYVGSDDDDNDGLTNQGEYFADTNPTNAASVLKLLEIEVSGGSNTVQYLNGGTGADVYVQYTDDLVFNEFADIDTNAAPSSTTNIYIHVGSGNTAFYQLRAERND